ncbi:MAG: DUF1330 domain-containing protein, partial [Pseudomonadota bacterium]
MPKGYVIARAMVTDPEKWADYAGGASAAMKTYGGTPIVRGGRCEVAEGEGRARNVVIEFPDMETALSCYNSPEYQAAREHRLGAGIANITIVEG